MLEIRLPAGERRVEVVATVDWQGMDGVLMFEWAPPLAGELWGGIPYGAERKDLEREPYVGIERPRPGAFYAQGFVDWSDGAWGLAYVPHNGDVYYVFDRRRRVLQHILINSLRRPGHNWEKDVNAGVEAEGRHSFTASLIWHDGDWRAAELWRQAESLTSAPLVVPRRRGDGPLPAHHSLLRLEPGNACLAALYRDGRAFLARLYETTGAATIARLTLPFPVDAADATTLLGESLPADGSTAPAVGAGGRSVSIPLRPWQVRTIALYPAPDRGVGA
jgi:alpha-mannosidase